MDNDHSSRSTTLLAADGRARRLRPPPRGRLAAGDARPRPARAPPGREKLTPGRDARRSSTGSSRPSSRSSSRRSASSTSRTRSRASRASASTPTSSATSVGAAFRLIPARIRTLEELRMPERLYELVRQAARPRARHRPDRLRQVDDARGADRPDQPRRAPSTSSRSRTRSSSCTGTGSCIVNQREIGSDATTFAEGLRAALRQDPDVILVGEMRDLETISTALTAAETGHLVFATLHTQSAPQTIDRVIDVFPAEQQQQVRVQLAATLQGVVTQNLDPDRRRPRPGRGARDPAARRRRPEPDPAGQDRADLLRHADEHAARHADDGAVARRPDAASASSPPRPRSRARPAREQLRGLLERGGFPSSSSTALPATGSESSPRRRCNQ